MQIHKRFQFKDLTELEPGELISINIHDAPAKAIVLFVNEDDLSIALLILVPIHGNPFPFRTMIRDTGYAISYGKDWVFDISDTEGQAPNIKTPRDIHGIVHVTPKGAFIRAAQSSGQDGGRCFINLDNFKGAMAPPADKTVDISKWKIWLNDEDRISQTGQPFVAFEARSPDVPL